MRNALLSVLLIFASPAHAGHREFNTVLPPREGPPTALLGGRLIDGSGRPPIEDAVVVFHRGVILAAGPRGMVEIPADARRMDASGLTILPGLIDVHLHTTDAMKTAPAFLFNGVTTFRDPGHPFVYYEKVRELSAPLPRIFVTGSHLDRPPPAWPQQARLIGNIAEARRVVHEFVDRGATAIKIYFRLPLEYIAAVCEEAAKRNVIVTAHLELVAADEAIRTGVRGIEHVTSFGTILATEDAAEEFRQKVAADSAAREQGRYRLWSELDLDDNARLRPLLELLAREKVFVSPTLAVFEVRKNDRKATALRVRAFENMLRFVGLCHRTGIRIVAGGHTQAPHAPFGEALHHEIALLAEAGLGPMEAIVAATSRAAEFLGAGDRLGSVEPGKVADMLIVAGNPLEDLHRLRDVRGVILNGNWIKRPPGGGTVRTVKPLASAAPLAILPLGDSITQGGKSKRAEWTYRLPLARRLAARGIDFEFVGSMTAGLEPVTWPEIGGKPFDHRHEGHYGWTTAEVLAKLPNWIPQWHRPPDIALIHLGSNDMRASDHMAAIVQPMKEIIGRLREVNPKMVILIGHLNFNSPPSVVIRPLLETMAAELDTEESPVLTVHHYQGWNSDPNHPEPHTFDWSHPNPPGQEKMAEQWIAALEPWLGVR